MQAFIINASETICGQMPVIPVIERLRKENHKSEASEAISKPCQGRKTEKDRVEH